MTPGRCAVPSIVGALVGAALLAACASQPDRFYTLSALPDTLPGPRSTPATQVILGVSIPAVVDRRAMVLATSGDEVAVLEHERWAAPLSDLIAQALAGDLERRRADVLVAERGLGAGSPPVKIRIDVVQLAARRAGSVTLEAHWRMVDARSKSDESGAEVLTVPIAGEDYAAVARALSVALGSLADRLAERLPAR
jgi:hypothetical protein